MVKTNKCMGIIKTEMRTAVPGNKSKEITVGESDPGLFGFFNCLVNIRLLYCGKIHLDICYIIPSTIFASE